jgi:hypothetical protein
MPASFEEPSLHSTRTLTVAALPLQTALFYAFLFALAFWTYKACWKDAPLQANDSPSYLRVAQDLSDLRIDQLNIRPPGYPILLVLTGSSEKPTRTLFYVSLVLHFSSIWFLAAVLYAMGMTGMWLNVFALLLVLPPYVEYAAYVLTENLSEFLLVLAFASLVLWFLRRGGTYLLIISAVAVAYSGLTRPTYQTLSLVITCFLLIACRVLNEHPFNYRNVIRVSLILLTVSVLFIGSFSLLNYLKFGFFGIYPMTGFNLSTRTVRVIERLPDEYAAVREVLIKARDAELILRNSEHTGYLSYWEAIPDLVRITGLKEGPELSEYMLHLNLLLIKKAPLNYLQEVFASFSSYWLPSSSKLVNMDSIAIQALWAVMQLGIVAIFTLQLLVILGLTIFNFSQRLLLTKPHLHSRFISFPSAYAFAYALASTIVLYNAFLTCLIEVGTPRYRVPTESLLIFLCFMGLYLWRHLILSTNSPLQNQLC